jgi:hypothetical protein
MEIIKEDTELTQTDSLDDYEERMSIECNADEHDNMFDDNNIMFDENDYIYYDSDNDKSYGNTNIINVINNANNANNTNNINNTYEQNIDNIIYQIQRCKIDSNDKNNLELKMETK